MMYFRILVCSVVAGFAVGCAGDGGGGGGGNSDEIPELSVQDVHAKQGMDLSFVIELNRPPQTDLNLTYSTAAVDASVPDDFRPVASAQITIPAGQTTATLAVPTYFTRLLDATKEVSIDIDASDDVRIQRGHASGFIEPRAKVIDRFSQIATGNGYACAITTSGGVQCWGGSPRPTDIQGLSGSVSSVSVAGSEGCALSSQGAVSCWLGVGQATPVPGLSSGVTAVSVGGGHNCAVVNGAVKCWGQNLFGELGNGTRIDSDVPVQVVGLTSGYVSVDAGGSAHTCALDSAGGVKCWGYNLDGELGINNTDNFSLVPVQVVGLASGVKTISLGGTHSCALKTDGKTVCWGSNVLADGANGGTFYIDALVPSPIPLVGTNVAISARGYESYALGLCGLAGDGKLGCVSALPAKYDNVETGVVAFSNYLYSRCSLVSGGRVRCSGSATGITAFHGTSLRTPMVPLDVGSNAKTTSGRCTVSTAGAVSCFDRSGQLIAVQNLSNDVRDVVSSETRSCAIKTSGQVVCWTNAASTPVALPGLGSNIKQLALGGAHGCALSTDGSVKCWGDNRQGQLGVASPAASDSPLAVPSLQQGVRFIAASGSQTCAVLESGGVKCWGNGRAGTLSDVSGLVGATSVAVANFSGCATTNGGALQCWRSNRVAAPVPLPDVSVASVSAGASHFCLRSADNRAMCWGDNTWGQLGNNSGVAAATATLVNDLHDVESIGSAGDLTCAVTRPDGRLRCFGRISNVRPPDSPYIIEYL